jgi:hypothetical protein
MCFQLIAVDYERLALQSLFTFILLGNGPFELVSLSWVLAIAFSWPLILMPIQELVKSSDKREFIRFQKRSKLEFNTKLGCYSPV